MKVLILGSGVIGVATAHYLAEAGHEVTVIDRKPGPALETSFANAGEVSPGYSSPWAGPGHSAEGGQVAADAPRPAGRAPGARSVDVGVAVQNAAQLHVGALRRQQGAHGADRRIQPRPAARAARRRRGIAYDERSQGTLQLFRTTSSSTASAATSRC